MWLPVLAEEVVPRSVDPRSEGWLMIDAVSLLLLLLQSASTNSWSFHCCCCCLAAVVVVADQPTALVAAAGVERIHPELCRQSAELCCLFWCCWSGTELCRQSGSPVLLLLFRCFCCCFCNQRLLIKRFSSIADADEVATNWSTVGVVVAAAADTKLNYELIQNWAMSICWSIDPDRWCCWSVLCCQSAKRKNRSSAPLKNRVNHMLTAL